MWKMVGELFCYVTFTGVTIYFSAIDSSESDARAEVLRAVQVIMTVASVIYLVGCFTWIPSYFLSNLPAGREIVSIVYYTVLCIYSLAFIGLQVGRKSEELRRKLKKFVIGLTMTFIIGLIIELFNFLWSE